MVNAVSVSYSLSCRHKMIAVKYFMIFRTLFSKVAQVPSKLKHSIDNYYLFIILFHYLVSTYDGYLGLRWSPKKYRSWASRDSNRDSPSTPVR